MNSIKKLLALLALPLTVGPLAAQYPVIPDSVKQRGALQQQEINKKSDEAWEKALPIILQEEMKGRPYKPWAAQPSDFGIVIEVIPVQPQKAELPIEITLLGMVTEANPLQPANA